MDGKAYVFYLKIQGRWWFLRLPLVSPRMQTGRSIWACPSLLSCDPTALRMIGLDRPAPKSGRMPLKVYSRFRARIEGCVQRWQEELEMFGPDEWVPHLVEALPDAVILEWRAPGPATPAPRTSGRSARRTRPSRTPSAAPASSSAAAGAGRSRRARPAPGRRSARGRRKQPRAKR